MCSSKLFYNYLLWGLGLVHRWWIVQVYRCTGRDKCAVGSTLCVPDTELAFYLPSHLPSPLTVIFSDVWVCMCGYSAHRSHRIGCSGAAVRGQCWGPKLCPSTRVIYSFNCWTICLAPKLSLKQTFSNVIRCWEILGLLKFPILLNRWFFYYMSY